MDKQPYGEGWDTPPNEPVVKDGKLFGRGSADDGYAFFASILAIKAIQENGLSHPRVVITIEGSEEGEIDDLLYYLKTYKHLMGSPTVVICQDSMARDDTLMNCTALRGYFDFNLHVNTADNGMHSGLAGGVAPNPILIAMHVLSRIVDFKTQDVVHPAFVKEVPAHVLEEMRKCAKEMEPPAENMPLLAGVKSLSRQEPGSEEDIYQQLVANAWKSSFTIKGQRGIQTVEDAGNVVYKGVTFVCTMRLPPHIDCNEAKAAIEKDLPVADEFTYEAKITVDNFDVANGFTSPKLPEDIGSTFDKANKEVFAKDPLYIGMGGSIPFMGVFGEAFPEANFLLTGAFHPRSNIHCANENLDIDYARKFVAVVSKTIARL